MRQLLAVFCFLMFSQAFGQQGYDLHFKIEGLRDTVTFLGYYYGESTFIKDTAKVNGAGEFTFDGKQPLPPGIYFVVLKRTPLFDFLISTSQKFSMETSRADYIRNMKVKGDPDNALFFENMNFNLERHKEAEPFIKILQDSTLAEDKKTDARASFSKVNEKVMAYQDEIIAKHPASLTARVLKASRPVKVPEPPVRADGKVDSTFQLRWYREHFFDNFDLSDEALIRMPRSVYNQKISEYLDRLYAPQPDTLMKAIERVIAMAQKNQETYKYSVWINVIKYQNPDIMGLDEIYVRLFDRYFASGLMDFWVNASLKKNLKEQADRMRKSLVGRKGDNLIMQDINLKARSMYDIKNKYTILFIFDPDCGHCKVETPKLVDFYTKSKAKFNVEVYAVSTDSSMVKMRDYIKTMNMKWITVNGPRTYVGHYQDHYDALTTPTVYILDDKKKIIAKKLPVDKLEEFFLNYEKFHNAKPAQKM